MAKQTVYREGDLVKYRQVSLECENSKISCPDGLRGQEGHILQIRTFPRTTFQDSIVVGVSDGTPEGVVTVTEQHHIRLLKRAPKEA